MRTTPVGHSPEWPTPLSHATDALRWIAEALHGQQPVTGPFAIHRSTSWRSTARVVYLAVA